MSDQYYDQDLLQDWARGNATRIPAPLSVRSRWYRKVIKDLLHEVIPAPGGRILSVGAGTGATETHLVQSGYEVTASDVDEGSRAHCETLGLPTIHYDITKAGRPDTVFDGLYVDGVLGHLTADANWSTIWRNLASLRARYLLLSNDLSDDDTAANHTVFGEPRANFYRPVADFFAASAVLSGEWRVHRSDLLRYRRPGRGIRRRELLVLRAVIGERTGGIGSH